MEGLPMYVTVLFVSIGTAVVGFPFVAVAWIVMLGEWRTDKTRNIPAVLLLFTASSFLDALTFFVCGKLPRGWSELPAFGTILSAFVLYSVIIATACMSLLSLVLAFFYKGPIRRTVQVGAAILVLINAASLILHRVIQYN